MENKIDNISRLEKVKIFFKNNIKYIISLIIILLLFIGGMEFYIYNEIKK